MSTENNIPQPFQSVSTKQWTDWRWQLAHAVKNGKELCALGLIDVTQAEEIDQLEPMRLTPYLLSCIDWKNPHDPIALQHVPQKKERDADTFTFDTVWEKNSDFHDGDNRMIQQKYPDIVLLRLTNTCHSYCRFCFQKERTIRNDVHTDASDKIFAHALTSIVRQPGVRHVLVSGGDPLILPDTLLLSRLKSLADVPQISTVRINTRTLLHNPYRITGEFARALGQLQKQSWSQKRERGVDIHIGLHFNHPEELTHDGLVALRRLRREGIGIYNQTVLLRGVNDSAAILAPLFRQLLCEGVRLHYLSQAMAVPGTTHLRTRLRRGQEIMRELRGTKEFRGHLPHFELSHHTGKQIIPDTMNKFFYEDTILQKNKHVRVIRFLSDTTQQWEVFPDGE